MSEDRDLTRSTARAKGRRPYFFDDPSIDKVLAITMSIAGELAVTRERLDTVERLLAARDALSPSDIDQYRPDERAAQERGALRQDYVARILRILQDEADALEQQKSESDYEALQKSLAEPG